ncbi:uncharacterized protein [Palaemon carinicauda]|uniref:uncharacterized protein n=1 Tax=Palaemon carinicauda TaxID=392227 RepID=UPI0035B65382
MFVVEERTPTPCTTKMMDLAHQAVNEDKPLPQLREMDLTSLLFPGDHDCWTNAPATFTAGNPNSSLPGRLAHLVKQRRNLPDGNKQSDEGPSTFMFSDQLREITASPGDEVSMARATMGSAHTHSVSPSSQEERNSKEYKEFSQGQIDIQEKSVENPGCPPVRFSNRHTVVLKARLKDINRVWRSKANNKCRDKIARIPPILRKRLQPWTKAKNLAKSVTLKFPSPKLVVHTDASLTSWGGYSQYKKAQELWSITLRQFHINVLEAMAVLLTLKKLAPAKKQHIRRNVIGLEHLGENLPIPTNKSVNEGPRQTQNFQRPSGSSSPQLAQEQLVPPSGGTGSPPSTDPQSNINTSSTNSHCVSFLKNSKCPNFMDFIIFAAQRPADIDPQNTLFLESDKRDSTLRQYDSAVKKLAKFLKDSKAEVMTMNLTVSFFRTLFESGLAASTITTIKSVLKKIFQIGFNIDLTDTYFSSIPRACARLKPSTHPSSVSWFLNDVLKLASDTPNESCDYIPLLRKTLFLMSLASGARISELSALSRDPVHIEFLSSGEILISPDKRFLAKNEDPQNRWSQWKIVPLPQDPSLCPVTTLKAYLNRTSNQSTGPLFIRENGGTITLKGIRQQILYFIKQANPASFPHVHDIRAVATSINYFHHMNFDELTKYTGWKSPAVFKRHYLKHLEALKFATVAAGNVVPPESHDP